MRLPDSVLRLKGFVKFRDLPEVTYEFQYAMGLPDYGIIYKDVPMTIVIIESHWIQIDYVINLI